MSDNTETSRQLLEIAHKTYRSEVLEELSGSKRYIGAMVANAMDIAARALERDDPAKLLEGLTEKTASSGSAELKALAAAIRAGHISAATHPELRDILLAYVCAKLEISNPRYLSKRQA